jgi:hypothetical protein
VNQNSFGKNKRKEAFCLKTRLSNPKKEKYDCCESIEGKTLPIAGSSRPAFMIY